MVVAVATAGGATGWGEMAPLGSFYSAAFAAGARAGVAELAPQLLGLDAAQPRLLANRMAELLRGHPYVRSAIDMACWDAAARERGQPLCEALGGRLRYVALKGYEQDGNAKMMAALKEQIARAAELGGRWNPMQD